MQFLNKIKDFITYTLRTKPWFIFILLILVSITSLSFHKDYYFMGWDNFSSFFNIPTNLWKTLFGTWREYRGLGLPSDSEVVDIFRQLFFLLLSPIFSEKLLDQLYLLFSLWAGVIGMYLFAYKIYGLIFPHKKINYHTIKATEINHDNHIHSIFSTFGLSKYNDLFGFIAAFFYLFNLNTLSVFFFPILPFVARFFSLPLLHLALLLFVTTPKISKKLFIFIIFTILFTSGSYITATVFITTVISLCLHSLVYLPKFRRILLFFSIFLLLNTFWLFPFANYTIQKSYIIQFAPSSLEGNESLLNKSPDFFSFSRQSIFVPTFFDMQYTDISTSTNKFFHPLSEFYNTAPYTIILSLFTFLYIGGSFLSLLFYFYTLFRHKNKGQLILKNKYNYIIWLPLHTFLFIFLSLKQYGPFGFIYNFISTIIPLFAVVFRFGDTKFHGYIAFSGSLLASFLCIWISFILLPYIIYNLLHFFRKTRQGILNSSIFLARFTLMTILLFSTLFVFRSYFTGKFTGFFMYTKIPPAYKEIAEIINKDQSDTRVLHLPFDKFGYWRAHSWGYFGSAFFNFMINKPYLDRTYEPGSMENLFLDNKIYTLQEKIYTSTDLTFKEKHVEELYLLLKEANIKHILLDTTVNLNVQARGHKYWGKLSAVQSETVMKELEKKGYVQLKKRYSINPFDYIAFTVKDKQEPKIPKEIPDMDFISLYEVRNIEKRISFIQQAEYIDNQLDYLAETSIEKKPGTALLQSTNQKTTTIYPFQRRDASVSKEGKNVMYNLSNPNLPTGNYNLTMPAPIASNAARLIKVTIQSNGNVLKIKLYEKQAPNIVTNNKELSFENIIGDIEFNLDQKYNQSASNKNDNQKTALSDLRLRIDNNIFSFTDDINTNETELGYVLVRETPFFIDLIKKAETLPIPSSLFSTTALEDCLGTKQKDYQPFVKGINENIIQLQAINGSICVVGNIQKILPKNLPYGEISLALDLSGGNLDKDYTNIYKNPISPLNKAVLDLPKPNNIYSCIQHEGDRNCYNNNRFFSFEKNIKTQVTLPILKSIENTEGLNIIFGLRNNGFQKQSALLGPMTIDTYELIETYKADLSRFEGINQIITIDNKNNITLKMPQSISFTSSFNNASAFDLTIADTACENENGYRTIRSFDGKTIMYTQKCGNGLFYTHKTFANMMYLWLIDFNLISGQYPSIQFADKYNEYVNQRIGLYQGYPHISNFKTINPLDENISLENFKKIPTFASPYILFNSPEYENDTDKVFSFTQYTENDGVIAIKSNDIIAYPPYWADMRLQSIDNTPKQYQVANNYKYRKILPSLWSITLPANTPKGTYLLLFREGYDKQWGLYKNKFELLQSFSSSNHPRCNGLFNCFEIIINDTKETTYYLFYGPEKLAFIGGVITLITVVVILLKTRKKKRNS